MKKQLIASILLVAIIFASFALTACSNTSSGANKFIELKDSEHIKVGSVKQPFMNYESRDESIGTLTYVVSATYTLRRTTSSYSLPALYVSYEGYYYYWESDVRNDTIELGTITTTKLTKYSYLPYSENENVIIKKTQTTKTSYDYSGGWIEKPASVTINLSGYFNNFADLREECPALASLIDATENRKYYVDTYTPEQIQSTEQFYDSYYYIEKN